MSRTLAVFIPGVGAVVPHGTLEGGEQETCVWVCLCSFLFVPFLLLLKLLFVPGHCPSDPPMS